jgi:hypothetical protein
MVAEHMNLTGSRREEFLKNLSKDKTAVKPPLRKHKSMSDM